MVLYHGAIRKKSPETNPSKRVPKLVCQIHDKAIYCSWWLQPISLNILKHIVQIGPNNFGKHRDQSKMKKTVKTQTI